MKENVKEEASPPFLICCLEWLCRPLSFKNLHALATVVGTIAYYLSKRQRKRVMSNLAIAKDLNLSEEQMKCIAKKSFQNL